MLVPDLADQLFQNVLHRHNAAGAAVFINHDGHMGLGLLKLFEQQTDGFHLQRIHRRQNDLPERLVRHAAADIKVLLMNGAENIIDRILIDQKS